ncbi:hypothetical protein [Sphingobacterium wenxiniae]|uniref:Uncharacterized protein n=1 Tax=Sphingobacterium wenxiniae TaxID=683125 RepID=A0A1I6SGD0_9SPHI|nr:hypothetical protein [Sphingobacterium wenxiniae]SFS75798.1 hypothetical protein SAMN05660206_104276 [Sphingobacterium wenxiniae]
MKKLLWTLLISSIFAVSCNSSSKKNEDNKDAADSIATFEQTQQLPEVITRFARAYISQDNDKVNALIHPDLGLYIIYRPGASDVYAHVSRIDFSNPVPNHFPYTTFQNDYTLTFEKLPVFDCGSEKWDKLGFFADTTATANQLTTIAIFRQEFENVSAAEVAQIKELEKDTYRIILTVNENLVFHVKKYEGAWYVIVLDRAYGWCDA